jgi:hypothetical protein
MTDIIIIGAAKQKRDEGVEDGREGTYCREESEQFTKTSGHYKLFLDIYISCIKK